ncbi:MAG: hypothetical protein IKP51_08435 [Treponema sp.]|nr:hypothetical protein [Treponema sp.]
MKKSFFAFVFFLFAVAFVAAEDAQESAAKEFSTGEWNENVYTNDFLGIKYTMPEGWTKYNDEQIAEMMNLGKELLNDNQKKFAELSKLTTVYHLLANNPMNGDTVCVITEKTFLGISAETYSKTLKTQLEALDAIDYQVSDITTREIAGREFSELKTTVQAIGFDITQIYYSYRLGKYILSIIVTSRGGDEGIDSMLKDFE